jgi:hypothetical protein
VPAAGAGLFPATGAAAFGKPRGTRRFSCPGRGAASFPLLRRAGTNPTPPLHGGPDSAAHHAATVAHWAASGARSVLAKEIGPPDHLAGRVPNRQTQRAVTNQRGARTITT